MNKEQLSFREEVKNFSKILASLFQSVPKLFYFGIAILFVVILGLVYIGIHEVKTFESNLPQAQIINDQNPGYSYVYDYKTKEPAWVLQVIETNFQKNVKDFSFYTDKIVPENLQSKLSDYQKSGFDSVALLDVRKQKMPLSIVSPQIPQGYWGKTVDYVKDLIEKLNLKHVLIVNGPLFLSHAGQDGKHYVTYQVIGENEIAVPTHFFKAIFYRTENDQKISINSEFYVIPNQNLSEEPPLETFRVSKERLEKLSGVTFPKTLDSYLTAHKKDKDNT